MPFILVSCFLILLLAAIFKMKFWYWLPVGLLCLLSIKPLKETVALNFNNKNTTADFSVMSFNAAHFNPYRFVTYESDTSKYATFNEYLRSNESADILCIQEFFYSSKSQFDNTLDSIVENGNFNFYYTNPYYHPQLNGLFGVITFSKFPAIDAGKLKFNNNNFVNGHWIDFLIHNDTIRVVNFQLESMSIRLQKFEDANFFSNIYLNLVDIYERLLNGYEARKKEMEIISVFLETSPHKVIICADINALPYSDTYQVLKRNFYNSFEKAGWGFGFTYHHFPWFIRIDNQFYDKSIQANYHHTIKNIEVSDHYPIKAGYSLP